MTRGPDPSETARDILLYMVQTPDPGFMATEVAGEFGRTRQWADKRLGQLEDDGLVKSKNPGGNAKFWWPTANGKKYLEETRDR